MCRGAPVQADSGCYRGGPALCSVSGALLKVLTGPRMGTVFAAGARSSLTTAGCSRGVLLSTLVALHAEFDVGSCVCWLDATCAGRVGSVHGGGRNKA